MMPYDMQRPSPSGNGGLSLAVRSAILPREDTDRPKKPKLEDLQQELDRIRPNFQLRNTLLARWRGTIRVLSEYQPLTDGWRTTDNQDDDRPIPITEPATIINDRIRKVGGMGARIKVAADNRSADAFTKADKSVTFLKNFRDRANKDYRAAGHGVGRQQALTRYLSEDGHCYERLLLVQDRREMPFSTQFLDPLDVYPVWSYRHGLEKLKRVYHVVEMEVGEIRALFGEDCCEGQADDTKATVVNYYDEWYTGVWIDGQIDEWIRKCTPHNYGCCPIIPKFNKGWVSRSDVAAQDVSIREATRGRSVIADHIGTIDRAGRHLAAAQRELYKAVDPPLHAQLGQEDDGVELNTGPAEVTYTKDPNTKIAPLPKDNQAFNIITTLMQVAKDSLSADQLMLDPNAARSSGFDRVVASLEAQTVLNDLVSTIEDHEAEIGERVLSIYKRLFSNRMQALLVGLGVIDADPQHPLGPVPILEDDEGRQIQAVYTADDVPDYIRVNVALETVNELNRVQMGGQILPQVGVLLSRYDALVAMDVPDPKAAIQRMDEEMAMQSPDAQKILQPLAILRALKAQLQEAIDQGDRMGAAYLQMQIERYGMQLAHQQAQPPQPDPMSMGAPPGPPGMPQLPPPPPTSGGVFMPPNTGTQPGQIPPSVATGGLDQMAQAAQALAGFGGV
ncbi:MAG: hypothetical protein AB7V46_23930 [Thermomicrobiales bacterium]